MDTNALFEMIEVYANHYADYRLQSVLGNSRRASWSMRYSRDAMYNIKLILAKPGVPADGDRCPYDNSVICEKDHAAHSCDAWAKHQEKDGCDLSSVRERMDHEENLQR